jgi:hypothetical protein
MDMVAGATCTEEMVGGPGVELLPLPVLQPISAIRNTSPQQSAAFITVLQWWFGPRGIDARAKTPQSNARRSIWRKEPFWDPEHYVSNGLAAPRTTLAVLSAILMFRVLFLATRSAALFLALNPPKVSELAGADYNVKLNGLKHGCPSSQPLFVGRNESDHHRSFERLTDVVLASGDCSKPPFSPPHSVNRLAASNRPSTVFL